MRLNCTTRLVLGAMLMLLPICTTRTLAAESIVAIDPYVARKVFYEEHWQHKIERSLKYVRGAIVCVNVELTPEVSRQVVVREFDGEASPQMEYARSSTSGNSAPVFVASKNGKSSQKDANIEEESLVQYDQQTRNETTQIAGLIPSRVQVAISVPESYVAEVWYYEKPHRGDQGKVDASDKAAQLVVVSKRIKSDIEETVARLVPTANEESEDLSIVFYSDVSSSDDVHDSQ